MFSDISSRVQENLSGVRVVRAYVQERSELGAFRDAESGLYRRESAPGEDLGSVQSSADHAGRILVSLLVLWFGGMQLAEHKISLGSFVMFNTYMGMLVWPMIAMGWVANLMERGRASLGACSELLEERPNIAAPGTRRARFLRRCAARSNFAV
jgi:ATP-binding cassette, subfamily B, multidrug efflux pump